MESEIGPGEHAEVADWLEFHSRLAEVSTLGKLESRVQQALDDERQSAVRALHDAARSASHEWRCAMAVAGGGEAATRGNDWGRPPRPFQQHRPVHACLLQYMRSAPRLLADSLERAGVLHSRSAAHTAAADGSASAMGDELVPALLALFGSLHNVLEELRWLAFADAVCTLSLIHI